MILDLWKDLKFLKSFPKNVYNFELKKCVLRVYGFKTFSIFYVSQHDNMLQIE